jgi:hypothetical protein
MPHHLLLVFLGLRLSGLDSAIEAAFSVAFSFKDRKLLVRDNRSVSEPDGGSRSELLSASRGAEVGAGPLVVVAKESYEENERVEGESNVVVEGTGDSRSLVPSRSILDRRGLCATDGTADGRADGYGLA